MGWQGLRAILMILMFSASVGAEAEILCGDELLAKGKPNNTPLAQMNRGSSPPSSETPQEIHLLNRARDAVHHIADHNAKLAKQSPDKAPPRLAKPSMVKDMQDNLWGVPPKADAEPELKRALARIDQSEGPQSIFSAFTLERLASLYYSQGRYNEAEPHLKRSLAIWEQTVGPQDPKVAANLHRLAVVYAAQEQRDEAQLFACKAVKIYQQRGRSPSDLCPVISYTERSYAWPIFTHYLSLMSPNGHISPTERVPLVPAAYEISQLARAKHLADVVMYTAIRFSTGEGELVRLMRQQQDDCNRWQDSDNRLYQALLEPSQPNRPPDGSAQDKNLDKAMRRDAKKTFHESLNKETQRSHPHLSKEIRTLEKTIADRNIELTQRLPNYASLIDARPLAVEDTQQLLGPTEALLHYVIGPTSSTLVVIRQDAKQTGFYPLALDQKHLAGLVDRLRAAVKANGDNSIPVFPVDIAYQLYQKVFAPAEPMLKDISHLIIVPDGPLERLPFSLLVTQAFTMPTKSTQQPDYRSASWLAKRYAVTVLPAATSLHHLRAVAKPSSAPKPFVGFGNPVLEGKRPAKGAPQTETSYIRSLFNVKKFLWRGGYLENVKEVRQMEPLQKTEEELKSMAKSLGAGDDVVHLASNATEDRVKKTALQDYRIIAFSTHAVPAGQFSESIQEPALVLTPPTRGTAEDDGLLTASEIAKLSLNADWVLLPDCNTAATDGITEQEALSGLATAFFSAGARTVLVSHWEVESEATVTLITDLFKTLELKPTLGRAAALRCAMERTRSGSKNPKYAHPIFWAPFVVIGESGHASSEIACPAL